MLVILDRDGVINEDSDAFIKSPEEWVPIPGSLKAIGRLVRGGWQVAVATNQSGLARGLFDNAALEAIHRKMLAAVEAAGGRIEVVVHCPHGPADGCECRKPKSGLYRQVGETLGVELTGVPVIGDSLRDLQAAEAVGARPILVLTGKGRKTQAQLAGRFDIPVYADLAAAASALLKESM